MEKKKWPWKRKSERSPGESESSGSLSSQSERYSDEQDASRGSPNHSTQSPEITSKAPIPDDEVKESVKRLTEKLSAALVNVSAKEELVKQHAKVAEEAVAGWEKAENEVAALKQQLEAAVQQNLNLEVRISHLDGALKECVRQLRQGRDEQEKRISDAIEEKAREWESIKVELEMQIAHLRAQTEAVKNENSASTDSKSLLIFDSLEKENSFLKQELKLRCKELESAIFERDLSIQAAETASKLQLESIKKVTKLEAECRKLQSVARKSSPVYSSKPAVPSYAYAESLTDSHSDSGERLNAIDIDTWRTSSSDRNGPEPSCSDSWASALITELDQFKSEKISHKSLVASSLQIDMMDDFLEMERLAALPDTKSNTPFTVLSGESIAMENPLRAEVDSIAQRVAELEKMLEEVEAEKNELKADLNESRESLKAAQSKIVESETKLEEVRKELKALTEAKELLESQLISMEVESRTMSANIDPLKVQIEKERTLSAGLKLKCQELESELSRTIQETAVQQKITKSNGELKIKQEDLAVAAGKLAECQKTIASLGRQLKSLATLEDFLIDTSNIPGFSTRLLSNDVFNDSDTSKITSDASKRSSDKCCNVENGNAEGSSSPSASSANHGVKSRNGFGKFFSKSKGAVEVNNRHD